MMGRGIGQGSNLFLACSPVRRTSSAVGSLTGRSRSLGREEALRVRGREEGGLTGNMMVALRCLHTWYF